MSIIHNEYNDQYNNQCRVSMSLHCAETIRNDCIVNGCVDNNGQPSYGKFINTIFINFHSFALANIQSRKKEKHNELTNDSSIKDKTIISDILDYYERELLKKISAVLSERVYESKIITLRNKSISILGSDEWGGYSVYHSKSGARPAKYIRAIIEEYSRLISSERKRIFNLEIIMELKSGINSKSMITLNTKNNLKHKILPIKIDTDRSGTHLYLAGISKDEYSMDSPISFRIDHITECNILASEPSYEMYKEKILTAISARGIEYLSSETVEIKIRLTENGKRKYNRILFGRPTYSRIEGSQNDIYIFNVPLFQIEVYFFKFGADAEIIEPISLRQQFVDLYTAALKNYQ